MRHFKLLKKYFMHRVQHVTTRPRYSCLYFVRTLLIYASLTVMLLNLEKGVHTKLDINININIKILLVAFISNINSFKQSCIFYTFDMIFSEIVEINVKYCALFSSRIFIIFITVNHHLAKFEL